MPCTLNPIPAPPPPLRPTPPVCVISPVPIPPPPLRPTQPACVITEPSLNPTPPPPQAYTACVMNETLDRFPQGGDAIMSRCMWRLGFPITEMGYTHYGRWGGGGVGRGGSRSTKCPWVLGPFTSSGVLGVMYTASGPPLMQCCLRVGIAEKMGVCMFF